MSRIYPRKSIRWAAATCGLLLSSFPAGAEEKPKGYDVSVGFDAAPSSLDFYNEAIVALNHDMAKTGFLFRMSSSLAAYQYLNPKVTGGKVDGDLWQFDLMPGYQIVRGGATLAGYAGFDYQDSQLTPDDTTNQVRGTKTGAKVVGSFDFDDEKQPIEVSLFSEYSTAFNTYYARLRVAPRVYDKLVIGPEGSVDGDTGYNGQRIGAYAKYTFQLTKDMPLALSLAGGHQFVSGSGNDGGPVAGVRGGPGTYATIETETNF